MLSDSDSNSKSKKFNHLAGGRRHWRAAASAVCFWATLLVGAGCGNQPGTASSPSASPPAELRSEIVRGPVRVEVQVAPAPVRLSDEPQLTLTIDSEAGVEVELPPFGEAVGDFLIRDFRESLPEIQGSRRIVRQTYTLEPLVTGPAQIDPILIEFTDNRPEGDGQRHRVETEALTLQVLSMVDQEAPSLADLKGYEDPITLPSSPRYAWLVAAGGAFACLALVGWWALRRRNRAVVAQAPTPREVAERELDALEQSELASRDVKRFYVELTGIVRKYIEDTTGIHAPEQTTEEFLREVGQGNVFSRDERQRLKYFLEAADLVKFAGHRPQLEDTAESLRRARRFVGSILTEVPA